LRFGGRQHTDFAAEGQTGSSRAAFCFLRMNPLTSAVSPFWSQARHRDRRPRLVTRSRILSALRRFFEAEGFVEVEPAILQASPGNETHLHGFATEFVAPEGTTAPAFLHTSPEFAMKKLLAAGETRIFSFSRVFRNRERGALHQPEFTMLEWYRVGDLYERLMEDCAAILGVAAEVAGADAFAFRGRRCDPAADPQRLTVRDAFLAHADLDLFASLQPDGRGENRDIFAREVAARGLRVADDDDWSDLFSRVLSEKIEPALGIGRPTILSEYPLSEAALARPHPREPRVAERFELYACGVELANAFAELTDPAEQRRRFEADMEKQRQIYGQSYPLDEDFLAALAAMPPASGAALGFDRLVMLSCGAEKIEDVQWTPVFNPFVESRP
jgi:elongation factor P--(R)-beta-lysine ligase